MMDISTSHIKTWPGINQPSSIESMYRLLATGTMDRGIAKVSTKAGMKIGTSREVMRRTDMVVFTTIHTVMPVLQRLGTADQ